MKTDRKFLTCTKKKLVAIALLYVNAAVHIFAFNTELEPILKTYPSVDAMEYVGILHGELNDALQYLEQTQRAIDAGDEPELYKKIRQTQLYYLTAFAYHYHDSMISRRERNKNIINNINKVIALGKEVIETTEDYSDIRWVVAVSMMLISRAGFEGTNTFLRFRKDAIQYAVESIEMDKKNSMARVVVSNFDSMAPRFAGARPERGIETIELEPAVDWRKPHLFEYFVSRIYTYNRQRNFDKLKEALEEAKKLYPDSWRLKNLTLFVRL